MKKIISILQVVIILVILSCDKEDEALQVFNFKIDPQGESQVTIDWDNISNADLIRFTIDTDNNFANPVVVSETQVEINKTTLDGLEALTEYFIKIEVENSGEIVWSEIKEFSSFYTVELVNYPSTDNIEICAAVSYISTRLNSSSRTAIFMHEYTKSKSSWGVTNIRDTLLKEGYLCISIDFRGHGSSTSIADISVLIDMPWLLRQDFDATLDYLESRDLERSDEIVVFGASMGACVATAVSSYENVIGGIAASSVEFIARNTQVVPFQPKGMFYIAGELDKNVNRNIDFEADAIELCNCTKEPSKYEIKLATRAHGVDLLDGDIKLTNKAIDWVRNL